MNDRGDSRRLFHFIRGHVHRMPRTSAGFAWPVLYGNKHITKIVTSHGYFTAFAYKTKHSQLCLHEQMNQID